MKTILIIITFLIGCACGFETGQFKAKAKIPAPAVEPAHESSQPNLAEGLFYSGDQERRKILVGWVGDTGKPTMDIYFHARDMDRYKPHAVIAAEETHISGIGIHATVENLPSGCSVHFEKIE